MNARRGTAMTMEFIVIAAVVLVLLIVLLFIQRKGTTGFIDEWTCSEEANSGLRQMPKAVGCAPGQGLEPYPKGFLKKAGYDCCKLTNFEGGGGDFGGAGASATYGATDAKTGKAIVEGQTVQIYATGVAGSVAKEFDIDGEVTCAKDGKGKTIPCTFELTETVMTRAGIDVMSQVLGSGAPDTLTPDNKGVAELKANLEFKQIPELIDEPLIYTLTVKDSQSKMVIDTYTLNIKMTTPVRYAGVTQQWSKRKEIVAACEKPVTCDQILFRVTKTATACDPSQIPAQVTELKTSYCVVKDGVLQNQCKPTASECSQLIFAETNTEYSGVHQTLMAGVREGLIPADVASQFSTVQGQTSTYQCIKTVENPSDASFYSIPTDPTTGRATFTLEHQAFENGQLCIYGRDKVVGPSKSPTYYAGKGPVRLMLDVTPPTANLDFRPGSLQLHFGCTDNAPGQPVLSGCKEAFGVAYIAQTGQFLRALAAKDTPQNAAAWCPPYATSGGYRIETRPITQYTDNEIRVLCLRVEDQAGNAGVAMATVYNAYDLAVQALAAALAEGND